MLFCLSVSFLLRIASQPQTLSKVSRESPSRKNVQWENIIGMASTGLQIRCGDQERGELGERKTRSRSGELN